MSFCVITAIRLLLYLFVFCLFLAPSSAYAHARPWWSPNLDATAAHGPVPLNVRADLHFPLHARGTNNDGTLPVYKDPNAPIEDRVNDLLPRMTLEEKVAQLCAYN